ncbi:MAG TPA: hypothetical protein ENH82_19615 [bacterium]|nr:hypothetical protein [bacterium]
MDDRISVKKYNEDRGGQPVPVSEQEASGLALTIAKERGYTEVSQIGESDFSWDYLASGKKKEPAKEKSRQPVKKRRRSNG